MGLVCCLNDGLLLQIDVDAEKSDYRQIIGLHINPEISLVF
jgi:hypothetical protein